MLLKQHEGHVQSKVIVNQNSSHREFKINPAIYKSREALRGLRDTIVFFDQLHLEVGLPKPFRQGVSFVQAADPLQAYFERE